MPAIIIAALWRAWAFVLPFAGPWLVRLAPWLSLVPGWGSVRRLALAASYVAALGLGAWGATKALRWWDGDKLTRREAQLACNTTITSSYATARLAAAKAQTVLLAARAARIAADEAELDRRKGEMDNAVAPTDREPVLAADDPWLRAWQRRR